MSTGGKSDVKDENIIYINFELSDYSDLKTSKDLDKVIKMFE